MKLRTFFTLLFLASCVVSFAADLPPCETNGYSPTRIYRITDLGTLGGTESKAHSVSIYGDIVGESKTTGNSNTHAFIWTESAGMRDLGPTNAYRTVARHAGVAIVGEWQDTADGPVRAVSWGRLGEGMHVVPTLGGPWNVGMAVDCNGYISGISSLKSGSETHGFIYDTRTKSLTDLGTLGGANTIVAGAGECSWVVGSSQISPPSSSYHAFLYRGFFQDLGTLGGAQSFGNAFVNNVVVGHSDVPGGGSHAFSYSGGQMIDLGTLGGASSSALSLNSSHHIVGWSTLADSTNIHATLWRNGEIIDLNNASATNCGWQILEAATSIAHSKIVGYGLTEFGERHAFHLTAVPGGVGNQPPTAQFIFPQPKAVLIGGTTVPLEVAASDPDGTITNVSFSVTYNHDILPSFGEELGTVTNAPFRINWQIYPFGIYPLFGVSLYATVEDNRGAKGWAYVDAWLLPPPAMGAFQKGNTYELNWLARYSDFYLVETSDPVRGPWRKSLSQPTITNFVATVKVDLVQPARFFRLEQAKP